MTGTPDEPLLEVVEFTDPMCPWAWGSEPAFRRLRAELGGVATAAAEALAQVTDTFSAVLGGRTAVLAPTG